MKLPSQPIEESSYRKSVLPNGIRVVSEEIPYVRSISIGVWINVGSRDEHTQKNGISHFLEHMVFKGTERYSARQIATSLEGIGGYLNAFTTKEHTCYYARILDDHLPKALDVISDLVRYPRFDSREMEKEKKVILEELKNNEDDPDELIYDYFDDTVFHDHPLANPILGRSGSIKSFSMNDLESYLGGHYIPSGIVVAAAGNLKHEKLVATTEKYFGGIPKRRSAPKRHPGPRRLRPGRLEFEKPFMQAHLLTGTIGYGINSPSRYSLMVLNTLLGEGMSSRLFQNIREKYGFAYSVYSFANLLSDTGNFGVYVGTDSKSIERTLELTYKELAKLKAEYVGKAELKRTKAQLKGMTVLGLESMTNRMMRLGSGEIYFGGYTGVQRVLKAIDAVTPDDVLELARKLFRVEKFSTVIIRPSKEAQHMPRKAVA
jgi:predicted Zn-dependent peptidase